MSETLEVVSRISVYMLGNTPKALFVQYAVLMIDTIFLMAVIVWRAGDNVLVLSKTRIFIDIIVASAANLAFYRGLLALLPERTILGVIVVMLVLLFGVSLWRVILQLVVYAVDRGRSLRDLKNDESVPFNLNWPLIRRCANQSLRLLVSVGAYFLYIYRS